MSDSAAVPRIDLVVLGQRLRHARRARGQTLAQNVEHIRGIARVSVMLTIQRAGSTNLNCLIHRTSWSDLGIVQQ